MRARRTLVAALVTVLALCGASAAAAMFTKAAIGGPMSVASATLAPPTALSAAQTGCKSSKPPTIAVGWTATSSSFATGYRVERATASGGPYTVVATVAIGTTSYLDADPALGYATTYFYRALSTFRSWTTASTAVSVTTLSSKCA
jgi:hypothetical protein